MNINNPGKIFIIGFFILSVMFASSGILMAQDVADAIKPIIKTMEQAKAGMTLWQMIQAGGIIMVILLILSIATVALIIYNLQTITENKLSPAKFSDGVIQGLEKGNVQQVQKACEANDNIISRITLSGLAKRKQGAVFAKEAMENVAKKEVGLLWQNISYLADVAAVAPLIGLLGTVIGMIQAFNVIAFQTAVVKPILLAGGVSKAMVTTAGGLIVAIPTLLVYSYFRGRVQNISNVVENYNTDIVKLVGELK